MPAERVLLGLVDDAHAAAADLAEDAVVAELAQRRDSVARVRLVGPGAAGGAGLRFSITTRAGNRSRISSASSGIAGGVLADGRPLAAAVALDELLGESVDQIRVGVDSRSWRSPSRKIAGLPARLVLEPLQRPDVAVAGGRLAQCPSTWAASALRQLLEVPQGQDLAVDRVHAVETSSSLACSSARMAAWLAA